MAEHKTELIKGHKITSATLIPGEKVAFCRCFQSKMFPFCDGTHRTLDSEVGPLKIEVLKEEPKD